MLSRIAESMFWIGRYVERAEDTARLLQTHLRLIIEDTAAHEVHACRNLLALMNVDHVEDPNLTDLLRILGYDAAEPTSIYFAYAAARDNARRAREVIPLDLWECVNTTWHQLPTAPFGTSGANGFLNWARERSAMFAGIARGIMVRDDGWQFMSMGRSLEQADMTSRLVASASLAHGSTQWPAVLRGCGGHDAFLRTYRGLYTDREAAEVLGRGCAVPAVDHAWADLRHRQPAAGGTEQRAHRTACGTGVALAWPAPSPIGVCRS